MLEVVDTKIIGLTKQSSSYKRYTILKVKTNILNDSRAVCTCVDLDILLGRATQPQSK